MSPPARSGGAKTSRARASSPAPRSSARRPAPTTKVRARSDPSADGRRFEAQGTPASQRALRRQGRRTMRKLLDAAMEAFSTRGYHATRVNDIVALARTSHGTFYLYFTNKEDILRALVTEALAEPGEYYPPLVANGGPLSWQSLREWVGHFSVRWTRAAPLFRDWAELVASDPELAKRARLTLGTMSDSLGQLVARSGGAEGVDPRVAGAALFAMVDRFHSLRRTVGQPVTGRDLDDLTTIVHRAFFQPVSANGSSRPAGRSASAATRSKAPAKTAGAGARKRNRLAR